jgi:hypothetical protein
MTLALARNRRLDALNKCKADRILVTPAAHVSQVKLPYEGTVAEWLMEALSCGVSVDQLVEQTGWSSSTVLINLYRVAKKSGLGIRREHDSLYMIMPEDFDDFISAAKVVNPTCEDGTKNGDIITIEAQVVEAA